MSHIPESTHENESPGSAKRTRRQEMALSVTRLSKNSTESEEPHVEDCRVLLAGTDTLDFGMYVEFATNWKRIVRKLAQLKRTARGTPGLVIGGGRCLILPGGKPNYPFHLKYPGFQLYLSRKSRPDGETPNVYISPSSEFLWHRGERFVIEQIQAELSQLAPGHVHECRMSRCDLAVDLWLPGGVTDQFVRSRAVSRVRQQNLHLDRDQMQTLYVGPPDSDIRLRIYNKSAEVEHSQKLWFLPLWGLTENSHVWRFEFQIRRTTLKAFGIHSLDDLLARRADLWQYLTHEWFSLRLLDNENVTRRTVHPLWQILQECAEDRFGMLTEPLIRTRPQPSFDASRSIRQAASSLTGFAARKGLTTFEMAYQELGEELKREFQSRSFETEQQRKSIQLGVQLEEEEEK